MYSRIIKYPKNKSFFLFGPRGTGKTSWVQNTFPSAIYIDLLAAKHYTELLSNPQRLDELFIPQNYQGWIIIDEVQRVPELLNEVHRLIEKEKYRFILTGSSARKLRRQGVNLLAGRALTLHMHPLTTQELGSDFDLNHSLQFGNLPSVYSEDDPKKYLEAYVQTYLREEVLQEGLTRNLQAFARFLEAASFSQASILNVSEVARECMVERKIVENYFSILEDLLIAKRLPVFNKKAKRKIISRNKFFFVDAGIYQTIRPRGPLDEPELIEGAAFETLFWQELDALNEHHDLGYKIFFWRTARDVEVDFICYGEKGIKAFEIKRSQKVRRTDLKGLKLFLKDYPQSKAYLLYGGSRSYREENVEIIPFAEALNSLSTILA